MKKVLSYVVIFLLTITIFINKVYAEDITIDKVISKFQDNLNTDKSNEYVVKLENNKIVVYSNDVKFIEYNYENNVISHNMTLEIEDPDSEEGFEMAMKAVLIQLNNLSLLNSIASLHGYSERDIRLFSTSDEIMESSNFDVNGYGFSVNEESETKIIVDFKVDIQKFKLVTNYNNAKAPELKFTDIQDNEIGIQAYADLEDAKQNNAVDEDDYVMVEIYRSKDGKNFEYLFSVSASSSDDIAMTAKDLKLESGTTYYYKAVVDHSKNFSQVYEVRTAGEKKANNTINLEKTNEGIVINIKANLEDGKFVKIYKSTNNQDFELLAEVSILNNEISYLDELVEKDKTYYYKVNLGDNNTITNSLQYDIDNTVDKTIENPQTGMFDNVLHVLLIIGISLVGLKVLNKNEKIKQL